MTNRSGGGTFPWLMYTGLVKDVASTSATSSLRMDWGQGGSTGASTDLVDATLNPLMTLRFSGNLGIGTTSPEAQLHIGPKDNDHIYLASSNNNYGWKIDTDDQGAGDVPFRIIKRTNDVDTTILTIKNQDGNVGIGNTDPDGTLHVQADNRVHITAGTVPAFTGVNAVSEGRSQLVLSSRYSDLVIASSYANNNHGSTLSFAAVNPSNTAEYRKFVINQGNWGSRKDFLDFGLSASAADPNPHSSINSTDIVLTLDGNNKRVGIGTTSPTELLDITAASGDYDAFIRLRSGSGATSPVTESGLKLTESGEYGFQFAHSGATDLLKIRHQNSAGAVDLDDIMVWNPNGNVGIGTSSPGAKLHVNGGELRVTNVDTAVAQISAYGSSQGTGRLYVGQSNDHGGGIEYNGDNSPTSTGAGADYIALYRVHASSYNWTARNLYNSNNWEFRGNIGLGTSSPTAKLHVDAGTGVATRITGATQWTNRPFAMMGRNAGRTYAPNVVVCNVTGYNSGIANTSNGRFTAPTGFSGYYLVTFSGLAGIAETGPNDRWYKNGADTGWGSSHVNSSSLTPSRWGMSSQCIIYLNQGDYLEHRVITGSHYGSSQVHSTHIVMYLHS
jgi:hypothetical protein